MKNNDYRPLVPVNPEGLDAVAESLLNGTNTDRGSESVPAIQTSERINPKEYIQVGMNGLHGKPVVISCYEIQGSNSKDYASAHRFVLSKGLYAPTPLIFTAHLKNVIEAQKRNKQLRYSDGTLLPQSEVEEIYKHLTTNYKDVFGGSNPGAWSWLNAKFIDGTGDNGFDLETITGMKPDGTFITKKVPLENKIWEDCFVDINFNQQGLANAKSVNQSYSQGNNIKFYHPRKNTVARFFAGSGRAYLNCDGYPASSNSSLGVFVCAEGAEPKNGGSS